MNNPRQSHSLLYTKVPYTRPRRRFLLGFLIKSNQTLLQGLLTSTKNANWIAEESVKLIKKIIDPDRIINFSHCLDKLNDHSLVAEIQTYLKAKNLTDTTLEPYQCSALSFVLLTSGDVLEDFDFKAYRDSIERLSCHEDLQECHVSTVILVLGGIYDI